jgi:hypothetical protein
MDQVIAEAQRVRAIMLLDLSAYATGKYFKATNEALHAIQAQPLSLPMYRQMCSPQRGRWDAKLVLYRLLQKAGKV